MATDEQQPEAGGPDADASGAAAPHVDTQSLGDVDTYVYETIATLEYQGRSVTRDEVFSVADLDDGTVGESLRRLTERRAVLQTDGDRGTRYEIARRGWSITPGIPDH